MLKGSRQLQSLSSILTIIEDATNAWVTPCKLYIKWAFGPAGVALLTLLDQLPWKAPWYGVWDSHTGEFGRDLRMKVSSSGHVIIVAASGHEQDLLSVGQALSWLCAAIRKSGRHDLSLSTIEKSLSFDRTRITVLPLQELASSQNYGCWHNLMVRSAIAHGWKIPERDGGVGLEISFEIMTFLSDVEYSLTYNGGLILMGFSSILVPIERLGDGIQWHLSTSDNETQIRASIIEKLCPRRLFVEDVDEIKEGRHFLGWCKESKTTLGTQELDIKQISWTQAQEKKNVRSLRALSFNVGSSGLGFSGGGVGGTWAVESCRVSPFANRN